MLTTDLSVADWLTLKRVRVNT